MTFTRIAALAATTVALASCASSPTPAGGPSLAAQAADEAAGHVGERTLDNGLRVVARQLRGTRSAAYSLTFRAGSPALLFPGDPLGEGEPLAFRFKGPEGYSPTGAAALPDGRLLVIMRTWRFGVPPAFRCVIVLADPAQIASGEVWTGRVVARLQPPLPSDNYEGIAVRPRADGSFTVWVISDDNFMRHQRTLLLQLRWQERAHEKARGKPRASSKIQQG